MKYRDILIVIAISILMMLFVLPLVGQDQQQNPYQELFDQNAVLQQGVQSGIARIHANNLAINLSQLLHILEMNDSTRPFIEKSNKTLWDTGYGKWARILAPLQGPVISDSTKVEPEPVKESKNKKKK